MSEARESLRRIAVVGAGQVGVIAAIALKRAVPTAVVNVIGMPMHPGALADRASTALPFTNRLHDRLGIDEERLVGEAGASHRLITRYIGWGAKGGHGSLAYGANLDASVTSRFARDWGGGARNQTGERPPGSIAEALVDAGRFAVPPPDQPTPISDVDYALRWNQPAYHALLVETAQSLGVEHIPVPVTAMQPDDAGGIETLSLANGDTIQADLYVDCTGPEALLLSILPEFRAVEWSESLPLRHMIIAKPQKPMLVLEDRFGLLPQGWRSEMAGRDGLQITLGVAPDIPESEALRALGAPPAAGFDIVPGCAERAWVGNVVALGDAATRFEPLGHFNLDLAHRQLDLLIDLLPGAVIEPTERAEYNRRTGLMAAAVRDTIAAHYAAPAARSIFHQEQRSAELENIIDQYVRRGRLPFREEAPLLGQEMQSLLSALGMDGGITPQTRAETRQHSEEAEREFAKAQAAAVKFAPPYAEWMSTKVAA